MRIKIVGLTNLLFLIHVLSISTNELYAVSGSIAFIKDEKIGPESDDRWVWVGKVISDPNTVLDSTYKRDLKSILVSKNSIEIRMEIHPSFLRSSYIILSYNNKKWKMRYLYHSMKDGFKKKTKQLCVDKDLQVLFDSLVNNNIFSIQNISWVEGEYNMDKEIFLTAPKIRTIICDGTYYTIEFKIGNRFRRYGLTEPFYFASTHPRLPEFTYMDNIVRLLASCPEFTLE